jgi:hypothetical protein
MNDRRCCGKDGDADAQARLLDMAFAFWRSTILLTADEIGLFTLLARTPSDPASVATHLGMCCEEAEDYLEALATLGLVSCQGGVYGNAPEAERFLVPGTPSYIGQSLAMARAAFCEAHAVAARLRAAAAAHPACPTLRERMWSDIAAILGEAGAGGQS